jgi:hypothetical protein
VWKTFLSGERLIQRIEAEDCEQADNWQWRCQPGSHELRFIKSAALIVHQSAGIWSNKGYVLQLRDLGHEQTEDVQHNQGGCVES